MRLGGHTLESSDYWLDNSQHINVLEAQPFCIRCFRLGNTLITSSRVDVHTDNRVLKSALENGGCWSSEVSGVLKDIFIHAGNTISALMFTIFRRVKIQSISLPEADQVRIVCCQIALGTNSNAFSGPTCSISCPWVVTATAPG